MTNFMVEMKKEKELEREYQGVLGYCEAKEFLKNTPYTAAKISGAITRFCRKEERNKPKTFIEMELFVSDLIDFWLDVNPDVHIDGEFVLQQTLKNYIAFSIVWKAKAKASNILNSELSKQVGKMLVIKNALGNAVKVINSRIAHDECPNLEIYKDFKKQLPEAFMNVLPFTTALFDGTLKLPEGKTQQDINRLIGAYLSDNPKVIEAVNALKQIETKETQTLKIQPKK